MSEVIDRVSAALAQSFKDAVAAGAEMPFEQTGVTLPAKAVWDRYAVVAIEAMRKPTDRMLDMGQHFYDKTSCGLMDIGPDSALNEAWDRMISVALE